MYSDALHSACRVWSYCHRFVAIQEKIAETYQFIYCYAVTQTARQGRLGPDVPPATFYLRTQMDYQYRVQRQLVARQKGGRGQERDK